MSLLEVQGVAKSFPGVRALDGVSLAVEAGEVHALVGENGAGKSTLIRSIGGAYVPDAGRVLLDGAPLPAGDPLATRRRGVSIIYQELALVPELTAAENVFLGDERRPLWLARAAMEAEAQRILDGLRAGFSARAKVASLSVAQQQAVEIARALRGASKVLILDEPTSSLPEPDARRLLGVVRELRGRGLGIVYISHRLEEIFAVADRVTVLRDGRVTGSARVADIDRRQLVRWMVGRDLSEEFPARPEVAGGPVLEVADLAVPGRVRGVSLSVRRGEILGLAGLVGSGRTSTGLALGGALRCRGTIRLEGRPVRFRSPSDALSAGVAYLTEDRKAAGVFPWLGVGPNLTVASLRRFSRLGVLDRRGERAAAERARADFDVRCAGLEQRAGTLSGGNQQKMLLARFLLEPRRVLVLDEPTRGVDVGSKAEIYALMDRLTRAGLAIVLISSDLPELLGMADRIVVLCEGRATGALDRSEATEERVMTLATPGAAA